MEKATTQALQNGRTVILADGDFPSHPEPLAYWAASERVVCCDGAASQAVARGVEPVAVVGDGDSISPALRDRLGARWVCDPGQDDNDLAKAFRYCLTRGWRRLAILGATGRREDHTLGNLSLLADFQAEADVVLATDTGLFTHTRVMSNSRHARDSRFRYLLSIRGCRSGHAASNTRSMAAA